MEGGTVAPGNSAGLTTVTGNYAPSSGSTLEIELAGLMADVEHDRLLVQGNAAFDGFLDVLLDGGFQPGADQRFGIIDVEGTASGQFAGAPQGSVVATFGSVDVFIDYQGGNGNDVELFTIPEPAASILIGVVLCGLGVVRGRPRRSKRKIQRTAAGCSRSGESFP